MDEVKIIDINDTTELSIGDSKQTKNDVVVLISSEGDDAKSPFNDNLYDKLTRSFADSIISQPVEDDDVVLLENNASISFSFEVEGRFQNDTAIESQEEEKEVEHGAKSDRQTQSQLTQNFKRSQSRLLDDIENSPVTFSLLSDDEEDCQPPPSRGQLSQKVLVTIPQSSPIGSRMGSYNYDAVTSSPTLRKTQSQIRKPIRTKPINERTESPISPISGNNKLRRPYSGSLPLPRTNLYSNSSSIRKDAANASTDLSSVALDLTKYMDYNDNSRKVKKRRKSPEANGEDSMIIDSDDSYLVKDNERPLFVENSSQSTPVNSKKRSIKYTEDDNLDEGLIMVNARPFSDQEYHEMTKKCLSSSEMKKLYNECNKVTRTEESIANEMVLTINHKIMNLIQSKHISLADDLKPLTIINNYEEFPIIRFKRKCTSIYDQTHGIFYPCEETIADESICVLVYEALPFFHRYRTDKKGLWDEIRQFSKNRMKVIVVIYGQNALRKKMCNMENRQHENRVLESLPRSASSQTQTQSQSQSQSQSQNVNLNFTLTQSQPSKPRGRKPTLEAKIKELNMRSKDLERVINEVTIYANVDVFPIENLNEFSNWMKNLVWVVGKMRYDVSVKYKEWSHLNVKSGKSPTDVLFNFLKQIAHVNEPKAKRVVSHYKTFQSLADDMKAGYVARSNDDKPLMLKSLERALHTLYTSDNPNDLIFTD